MSNILKNKFTSYILLISISFILFQISVSCSDPVSPNIYEINKADCTACGKCYEVCPAGAIEYSAGEKPVIIQSKCIRCGKCANICPEDAIH